MVGGERRCCADRLQYDPRVDCCNRCSAYETISRKGTGVEDIRLWCEKSDGKVRLSGRKTSFVL